MPAIVLTTPLHGRICVNRYLLRHTQSICLLRVYDFFFSNDKLFHLEYKALTLVCNISDKGSSDMKIWEKTFQTRKWWRRKKNKWEAKYFNWKLKNNIMRKQSLSIKIYPKAHWVFDWGCSGQGNNDARSANTVNCPFQVSLSLLHEESHLLSDLPPFLKWSRNKPSAI